MGSLIGFGIASVIALIQHFSSKDTCFRLSKWIKTSIMGAINGTVSSLSVVYSSKEDNFFYREKAICWILFIVAQLLPLMATFRWSRIKIFPRHGAALLMHLFVMDYVFSERFK